MPDGKGKKKKVSEMTPQERKKASQKRYANAINKAIQSGSKRKPVEHKTKMGAYRMVPMKKIQDSTNKNEYTNPRMQAALDKEIKQAGGPHAFRKKASKLAQSAKKNLVKVGNKYYNKTTPMGKAKIAAYKKKKK